MVSNIKGFIKGNQKIFLFCIFLIYASQFKFNSFVREMTLVEDIRKSDHIFIEEINGSFKVEANPLNLVGDLENPDDLSIIKIPLKEVGIKKNDFTRVYKLTFSSHSNKKYVAYLSKVKNEENIRHNRFDALRADSERKYFYSMLDGYYALEINNKYFSLSENQSIIYSELLNIY